jgi:hypothetical protein
MERVHTLAVSLAALASLILAAPAGAAAAVGHPAYCINRPSCASHLIWKRSEAWSGFQQSGELSRPGSRGFASRAVGHRAYCINRPSCASHLIWKRSEAWNGFQASAGIQGGGTHGFPWAEIALAVGLACACALTLISGLRLRGRNRARSLVSGSG